MNQYDNRYASPSFLSQPPRSVPRSLKLRLIFGGFMNQFGWFFFGFGMIFFWVFVLNSDPLAMFDFRGDLKTAKGKINEVIKTNMSEGGGEHSDGTPIYQFEYGFQHEQVDYQGTSYSVGQKKKLGETVTIEFPAERPERSRIVGMRTSPFSAFVLLILLFPIVGICFIIPGFRAGTKASRLLRIGNYTTGKLIDKKPTSMKINKQTVYKLTFEFQDEAGQTRQATAATHQTETLEDDDREALLYDPFYPDQATLLDHLSGRPEFDENGNIKNASAWSCLISCFIPFLSIVGHSIAFYYLILK